MFKYPTARSSIKFTRVDDSPLILQRIHNQLHPRVRIIKHILNSKAVSTQLKELQENLKLLHQKALDVYEKQIHKSIVKERRRKRASLEYRATKCLQHSTIMLVLLTVILQLSSLLIGFYFPEIFLDEQDQLVEIVVYQPPEELEISKTHISKEETFEYLDPKLLERWRSTAVDFFGGILWLKHNQVSTESQRTKE